MKATKGNPVRLSKDQHEFFHQNGYLVIPNALSDSECEHYLALVDELAWRTRRERGVADDAFVDVRAAVSKEPGLMPLLTQPTVFSMVVELMGANIQLNISEVMLRPPQPQGTPETFKGIHWHTDGSPGLPAAVHGTIPWVYTKVGYFLTDLSHEGMGNLRIVPGSHQRAEHPPMAADAIDPDGAIELTSRAGDAVIFQQRLWHSVGPNLSDITRKNIYMGYCQRWVKPLDYLTPDPTLLQDASPVERQLLGDYTSEISFWIPEEDLPLKTWLTERESSTS